MTDDHQPVMVEEVLHFLAPSPGGTYIDATLGAGGHAEAILRSVGGRCTLIGVDRDPKALSRAAVNLRSWSGSIRLVRTSFGDLPWVVSSQEDIEAVDGILLDIGMSSMQLDDRTRGFSFRSDGPLDMRMDTDQELTAADVVNTYSTDDLARVLRMYGEERFASQIARAIVSARRQRPLRSTSELTSVIEQAYPSRERRQHPARRTFQALRIEVNDELGQLRAALTSAPDLLAPGGRIVVLSYHSLEDRIVSEVFGAQSGRRASLPGLGAAPATGPMRLLTKGAVVPSDAEIERNPRASAAKLRAAQRTKE